MEGQVADCGRVTLWGSPWPPSGREGLGQGLHVIMKSFHMPTVLYSKILTGEGGSHVLWRAPIQEDYKQRTLKLLQKDFKTIQCILSKLC